MKQLKENKQEKEVWVFSLSKTKENNLILNPFNGIKTTEIVALNFIENSLR